MKVKNRNGSLGARSRCFFVFAASFGAVIFLWGLTAHAFDGADANRFTEVNRLYRDGKFKEAAEGYKELAEKYPRTAVFHYNLGNSLHRSRELGQTILAFERAKAVDPRNPDITYNLKYARGLVEYKLEDKRNWYLKAAERVLELVTDIEIWYAAGFLYFIFMLSWVVMLFFRPGNAWGWKRKTLLVVLSVCILVAGIKTYVSRILQEAIVLDPNAAVHFGPAEEDQIAFRLGEGLKVRVIDHREDWSRIYLVNGESGWMQNSDIGTIYS